MNSTFHPVIIVGGGPAGLTASILLSRAGVEHVLVEREKLPAASPRAHVINQRTMEIFGEIGVAEAVREAAAPDRRTGLSVWCTSLAGRELGRRRGWGHGDDERAAEYRAASPCVVTDLGQHRLEPILRAEAARHSEATLRFGHEMSSFTQDGGGVAMRIRSVAGGAEAELRGDYLVAADGASSGIRERLGIALQGEDDVEEVASTYFCADLSSHIDGEPALLYWLVSPGRDAYIDGGVFICHGQDEWLYAVACPLEGGRHELGDPALVATLRRATGVRDLDPEIRDHSHWVIHGQVAERYSSGRVFLAGDAAHRFPQAGGRGLNTAVQDSHNLAWKLAAVLTRRGGPGLLESYSSERRPVGLVNARDSLENMRRMAAVGEALAPERGGTPADALAALDADTDSGERRRLALARAVADQDPQFDALGAELGFHYESGAVVPDGDPAPTSRDPVREYVPTTRPGHRLPHAWLRMDGRRVSSLELVGDRLTLLLDAPGGDWARAAAMLGDDLIRPLMIAPGGALEPEDERWISLREVGPAGALLVRPDGHVAWRSHGGVDDPASALRAAVATIMDREPR